MRRRPTTFVLPGWLPKPGCIRCTWRARFGDFSAAASASTRSGFRLARAARLLAEGREDAGRIALRAGHYDHSHMSRDFGARTGVSPSEWRRLSAA
jgi:AraC-like DNA-binding protein